MSGAPEPGGQHVPATLGVGDPSQPRLSPPLDQDQFLKLLDGAKYGYETPEERATRVEIENQKKRDELDIDKKRQELSLLRDKQVFWAITGFSGSLCLFCMIALAISGFVKTLNPELQKSLMTFLPAIFTGYLGYLVGARGK